MKKTLLLILISFAFANTSSPKGIKNGIAVGLSSGTQVSSPKLYVSLRALEHTPLELEGGYVMGKGFDLSLRMHFLYFNKFSVHLIDPGVYFHNGHEPNNTDIRRKLDYTVGGGLDFSVWKDLIISAGARIYLPDPGKVVDEAELRFLDESDFLEETYKEAARKVQVYFGLAWHFL